MLSRELRSILVEALLPIYGEREAESGARLLLSEMWGVNILDDEKDVDAMQLDGVVADIKREKPLQQIIGHGYFYDRAFKVNEDVLTPRQETEELVHWIKKDFAAVNSEIRILDIGVGSGAIAVTLSLELPHSVVQGVDISRGALAVAESNNRALGGGVAFACMDILTEEPTEEYDIIVSNPPYIPQSEAELMRDNVLLYEPHLALFVEDSSPLLFYRRNAEVALRRLRVGGVLYFEIHESFGFECCDMLNGLGYSDIVLKNDLNDKPRMVRATKK